MKTNNKDRLKELIERYKHAYDKFSYHLDNKYGVVLDDAREEYLESQKKLNTFLDSVAIVDRRKS